MEEITLEKASKGAFDFCRDYRQAKLVIESRTVNERFTRNQSLLIRDLQGRVDLNEIDDNLGDFFNEFISANRVRYQVGFAFRYPPEIELRRVD